MQTHRSIPFGDGEYTVMLGMGQVLAIEEKCSARIGAVYAHVMAGRYAKDGAAFGYGLQADFGMAEVIEICRQGLIGGAKGFVDDREITVGDHLATHLVRTYLHPENGNPLTKAWDMATVIMDLCVSGYEPAVRSAQKKRQRTRKAASTGARSSATA